jgi:hypothetical protein
MFDAYLHHSEVMCELSEGKMLYSPKYTSWQAYREFDLQLQARCTDIHPDLIVQELKQSKVVLLYNGHPIMFREDVVNAVQRAVTRGHRRQVFKTLDPRPSSIKVMCTSVDKSKIFKQTRQDEDGIDHVFYLSTAKVEAKDITVRVDEREMHDDKLTDLLRKLSMHRQQEGWSGYLLTLYSLSVHKPSGKVEAESTTRHGTWNEYEPQGEQYDW